MTRSRRAQSRGRRTAPRAGSRRLRGAGRTWVEIRVAVSSAAAEAVAAILHDLGTGGLVEERPAGALARFRCYLPPSPLVGATLRSVRARIRGLRRYGIDPGLVRVSRRAVPSRRWTTAWRAHVRPVRVGRILIRPSWATSPRGGRAVVVRIDPGMAFGTGMHPSTRLCLRALQRFLPLPRRSWGSRGAGPVVLDVGTGSGILAIAAAKLGAGRVWAVDHDAVAVAVARGNVRVNGVVPRVRVVRGSGLAGGPAPADLILANLIAEEIVPLLPRARERLAPGGVFVGSGIVADRVPEVLRAARAAGFGPARLLVEGEWRAVVLRAPISASTRRRRTRR